MNFESVASFAAAISRSSTVDIAFLLFHPSPFWYHRRLNVRRCRSSDRDLAYHRLQQPYKIRLCYDYGVVGRTKEFAGLVCQLKKGPLVVCSSNTV
jgi:hypothetical protein